MGASSILTINPIELGNFISSLRIVKTHISWVGMTIYKCVGGSVRTAS